MGSTTFRPRRRLRQSVGLVPFGMTGRMRRRFAWPGGDRVVRLVGREMAASGRRAGNSPEIQGCLGVDFSGIKCEENSDEE